MKTVKRMLVLLLIAASLLALAGCTKGYPLRNGNHCVFSLKFYDEPHGYKEVIDCWRHGGSIAGTGEIHLDRSQTNKLHRYINSIDEWKDLSREESDALEFIGALEIMENPVSLFLFTEDGHIYFEESSIQLKYGKLPDKAMELIMGFRQ